ncbi:LytR/AlgR family response regulator transcription factor [Rossellomorea marisflavi]|jgi:two-component system, LytTR family, response regulator NatR|uniref:LuxR family transcriptional regulator n=1 Tax=Rossellomorea marisflavi TaxID=189381 RepID=A0A0J5TEZ0_9BACI|nr:LytTR family DNA-binding domain-containing protein [Rossellomorea marisflavi]VXC21764.1 two-component response regulator (NatK) [Bacillus sp. 349Y]KMK94720.1 LuxR family transcriptional regulator [Rossellomorea marisflavi]KML07719.1 LuxR family transcriptional regulator [Rossellomorea marisflavi]KML28749.1 LuxR family transcriptional regulator [Rossellomorea marisflavi]KZE47430.1 LuxR family transcriptional regulator [Rossellomorea marisflavi]
MKIGLVDDRVIDLDKLQVIVSGVEGADIVFSTTSAEEAYEQIKKETVDLLICDIEMPHLSGYELADIIHSHALSIAVIFVTANSGYAVHAFELNVHDYIMKPYSKERLQQSVQRLMEKSKSAEMTGRLYLKQKNNIHIVQKKDIIFIERSGRSTTIYTRNEQIKTYLTLNELEGELRERDFIRSHRSFIINIHYVKNFSLYAKNSYVITFEGIEEQAMITKEKVDFLQEHYF